MRQTLGFLFFMLFLAGLAFAMLKNLRSMESAGQDTDGNVPATIISGAWYAQSGGSDDEQRAFVHFQPDGKISGFAGCNRFFGTFVATDNTLEVGVLGTTRMACPDAIMRRETAFLQGIEAANGYQIDGRLLELRQDGNASLRLELVTTKDN
jgi:heat shock protein HslJ